MTFVATHCQSGGGAVDIALDQVLHHEEVGHALDPPLLQHDSSKICESQPMFDGLVDSGALLCISHPSIVPFYVESL